MRLRDHPTILLALALSLGPSTHVVGQDSPTSLYSLALDTTVRALRARDLESAAAKPTPVYLRTTSFRSEAHTIRQRRLPRKWLDSLQAHHVIAGTCPEHAGMCDRPISGYLVTLWEPQLSDVTYLRLDVAQLTLERPLSSKAPTFAPDSRETSYRDRVQIKSLVTLPVAILAARDSAGAWTIVEHRFVR
ncbi:MAG: hypothetical protein IPO73_00005 [Gemmatimonadetes bacterium]|nr:hypothetical protein [Gemmatimonadota bacterium]MBK9690083.1 hypothetical protein [Gemmatimonadota bacterium]